MANTKNQKVALLSSALHSANECVDRLRVALKESSHAEGILILDLIEKQAKLTHRIEHLRDALFHDGKGQG